jgi:hypothetical protein
MVVMLEQKNQLKNFMEGKYSIVANLSKEVDEEDLFVNKVGVKKSPFYIFVKIVDNISHCYLIDGDSSPSVMSKIIMEELGLSCTNKNTRSMLSYNSLKQMTIGEIKDVTLVLCTYP